MAVSTQSRSDSLRHPHASGRSRYRWVIRGQVQGVGFRPAVYRVANQLGVSGFVCNESSAAIIEAEASPAQLDQFWAQLVSHLPALARLDHVSREEISPTGEVFFIIAPSRPDLQQRPTITVDTALCPACLREMTDSADLRYRYPLINCTQCGPRYSIIRAMPYDRRNTTMADFALCEDCQRQYTNPADRHFHAQPVACAKCGPHLELFHCRSSQIQTTDVITTAVQLLLAGQTLALKGIGGFHLACRADDARAVQTLRQRKKRDAKPFALMCANLDAAKRLVDLSDAAIAELTSPAAPIVLARVSPTTDQKPTLAHEIAPGMHRLGVMLPYTPIHHLLFIALAGQCDVLVMTSANLTDEPLVKDNQEARQRLSELADAILWHDRAIERCVDDSIVLDMGEDQPVLPIRRARGYVPQVIHLQTPPHKQKSRPAMGLCVGGELKNTIAIVRGDEVIVSQHLGDLKHTLGFAYFQKTIADMCQLLEVTPRWIAHDLHPGYLSTQWATSLAKQQGEGIPLFAIPHHHAHAAAVLAEHRIAQPALAVVCDGVGYGPDGSIWGGELLELSSTLTQMKRLAHLRPILLPGGDAAAKDTRRCAAGILSECQDEELYQTFLSRFFPQPVQRQVLQGMLQGRVNCIASTAAGRYFDAVAAILGLCQSNEYEAQAPMALESAASSISSQSLPDFLQNQLTQTENIIDLHPLVVWIARESLAGHAVAELAWIFHEAFACAWASRVLAASRQSGIRIVALSGGVFCNAILTFRLQQLLEQQGMRVLRHQQIPPNDGGIAFGQAAIAAALYKEAPSCA